MRMWHDSLSHMWDDLLGLRRSHGTLLSMHTYMSHGTRVQESQRTYEVVKAHVWSYHSTRTKLSQRTYEVVTAHVWSYPSTRMKLSQHTYGMAWLSHACDMPHSYVCHDSVIRVTCLVNMCDMTHSKAWHDSFSQVTWRILMDESWRTYVMAHVYESWHTYMSHGARIWVMVCESWQTYEHVW